MKHPREGSKQALVVHLLSRPEGASLDDLIRSTGWLPHTTRAALTGLRKRGFAIERFSSTNGKDGYRIAAAAPEPEPVELKFRSRRRRTSAKAEALAAV